MLIFHPVTVETELKNDNPLHVGKFFSLRKMWWSKRKQRQGLILSIALGWMKCTKQNTLQPGFVYEETLLTALSSQVKDARVILEKFFTITQVGYNFNNGLKSATQISPRKLSPKMIGAIWEIIDEVKFAPGPSPTSEEYVYSPVTIQKNNAYAIRTKLKITDRQDLLPAVNWILEHPEEELTFVYERAGSLGARDKSIWPIRSIEMWPGWLRTMLFGRVVDIENAYCQFIISHLKTKYADNKVSFGMKYCQVIRLDADKTNFRNEICTQWLKLEPTKANIGVVKKLIMSLANGSNISPQLLAANSGRSEAVRIVMESAPHLTTQEMMDAGKKLSRIAKQFRYAKKDLCFHLLNAKPNKKNQRDFFRMYLDWERECRYRIWHEIGKSGLMLHDGLDGVVHDLSDEQLAEFISDRTSIRVSVDSYNEETNEQ